MRILFLCTGNIFRSPIAEGIMKKLVSENGLDIHVQSAGLHANPGSSVSGLAAQAAAIKGLDLSQHRSQIFNRKLALETDLFLVMDLMHKKYLLGLFPEMGDKINLLSEFAGAGVLEVVEPTEQVLDKYSVVADQIDELLCKIIAKVKLGRD